MSKDDYGTATYNGRTYTLTSFPELTCRVFPNCFTEVDDGEEYTSEWSARAVDENGEEGNEYKVVWQFEAVKGTEPEDDSDWPWDIVSTVRRLDSDS